MSSFGRTAAPLALAWLVVGCGPKPPEPEDEPERAWTPLEDSHPAAILSINGRSSTDFWVAGGQTADGATAMHWDGSGWTALDDAPATDLWWVFPADDGTVWFSGKDGTIVHHDPAAGTTDTIPTGTEATLYGIWGSPGGPLYAVGAYPPYEDGGTALLRIDGGVAEPVTDLPPDLDPDEWFFKVWGSAADDVYVIGDRGGVLHFDGTDWSRQALPGDPRLITVHGRSADDMVVVGGLQAGLIFEQSGGTWADVGPASVPPLNGVYVRSDGYAAAAGFSSVVLERVGGVWSMAPFPESQADWHATWIDDAGAIYVAGGDLMNLDHGVVMVLEPEP